MTTTLLDTGPLVALVDRSERAHEWTRAQFATMRPPLHTCEPVVAEAMYLLRSVGADADAVLDLVKRGVVSVAFRVEPEIDAIRTLMRRYAPRMDLADACLVRMTELRSDARVLTLDGDFLVYRRHGRNTIPVLMPPHRARRTPH